MEYGQKVRVDIRAVIFEGIVVGKATTDITQCHIIRCTDGTLPNETYRYDTVSIPESLLTPIGGNIDE